MGEGVPGGGMGGHLRSFPTKTFPGLHDLALPLPPEFPFNPTISPFLQELPNFPFPIAHPVPSFPFWGFAEPSALVFLQLGMIHGNKSQLLVPICPSN